MKSATPASFRGSITSVGLPATRTGMFTSPARSRPITGPAMGGTRRRNCTAPRDRPAHASHNPPRLPRREDRIADTRIRHMPKKFLTNPSGPSASSGRPSRAGETRESFRCAAACARCAGGHPRTSAPRRRSVGSLSDFCEHPFLEVRIIIGADEHPAPLSWSAFLRAAGLRRHAGIAWVGRSRPSTRLPASASRPPARARRSGSRR